MRNYIANYVAFKTFQSNHNHYEEECSEQKMLGGIVTKTCSKDMSSHPIQNIKPTCLSVGMRLGPSAKRRK